MLEKEMIAFRTVIMRGGTSKGIFFLENDLPKDPILREKVILAVFGSPDARQIDGLGGADPLTSKLAIIGHSEREDADVDYTFGQVDIHSASVDFNSNCGNISSAVGPFAILQSLVNVEEPVTKVRIYNTNTKKVLVAHVPVVNGEPKVDGDFMMSGVPRPGAKINLDYSKTAGSRTGKLLPTGQVKDIMDVSGIGKIDVSIVDAGNPMVFVRAKDIGLTGTETAKEVDANKKLLDILEEIRGKASVAMGLDKKWQDAAITNKATPMVAFVAPPQDYYCALADETISEDRVDFLARGMFMYIMHKTYAGTASVCTSAAAKIPGTVVNEMFRKDKTDNYVRIGHPGGIVETETKVSQVDGEYVLDFLFLGRTARKIMEGTVYVPKSFLN